MKVLGIIAEYNPFHNGHLYHLMESKKIVKPDYIVAVISGNFTQRGEPALFDKWIRTEMALKNGIDLVIELPVVYACQTAELFAFGGIQLLNNCNLITHMSFGAEIESIDLMSTVANILVDEPMEYKDKLKMYLDMGHSYPVARNKALLGLLDSLDFQSKHKLDKLLKSPNSILGIEYMKALIRTESSIQPVSLSRINANYHDDKITGHISSATAIRNELKTVGLSCKIKQTIPNITFGIIEKAMSDGLGPIFMQDFEQLILGTLRIIPSQQLANIMDVEEGLENRIKRHSMDSGTLDEFLKKTATRRYVFTRIQRILINTLLNNTTDIIDTYNNAGGPQYIRILGFQKRALPLMRALKLKANIPIITKAAHYRKHDSKLLRSMFLTDILATDLYMLSIPNSCYRIGGKDFKTSPIIVD